MTIKLSDEQIKSLKVSIENTRQDLLEALTFSDAKNIESTSCKVKSAIFNNTKTLNILNKAEKKG